MGLASPLGSIYGVEKNYFRLSALGLSFGLSTWKLLYHPSGEKINLIAEKISFLGLKTQKISLVERSSLYRRVRLVDYFQNIPVTPESFLESDPGRCFGECHTELKLNQLIELWHEFFYMGLSVIN